MTIASKFKVGDVVMCNLDHPKIKANKEDSGWTAQYYQFLKGCPATVIEVITGGDLSYRLELEAGNFYTEEESEVIPFSPQTTTQKEPKPQSALDKQVSGNHYKDCGIQPIEYIHANGLSYLEGNVIKYTTRHSKKNGKADIEKAIHYLELILEMEYKGETN